LHQVGTSSLLMYMMRGHTYIKYGTQFVDIIPSLKAINVACCGFSGLNYRTGPRTPHSDKRIRFSSY